MNSRPLLRRIAEKLRADPIEVLWLGIAYARGCLVVARYGLWTRRVTIRLPFKVYGRVRIVGPGSVTIGRNCSAYRNAFDGLTIATLSRDAEVKIGNVCALGGLTIRCRNRVLLGDNVMTANCLLQDSPLSMSAAKAAPRNSAADLRPSEICIEDNAWLASQTIVLAGSRVGRNSVLSLGSTANGQDVPADSLAIGSPVLRSVNIDRIGTLLGEA